MNAAKKKHTANQPRRRGRVRARLPMIPLSVDGIWRTGHVLAATGWSHGTLYNRIKEGKWPAPIKDGALNGWSTSVCREALRALGHEQV